MKGRKEVDIAVVANEFKWELIENIVESQKMLNYYRIIIVAAVK